MYAVSIEYWNALRNMWVSYGPPIRVHNLSTAVTTRKQEWESLGVGEPVVEDIRIGSDWVSKDGGYRATIRLW